MAEIFQPVRGTQAAINRQPIREGYVYYAYDSGRIYLDKNGNRYLMSSKGSGGGEGGSGIIYANGSNTQIIPEDLTEREPTVFIMDLAALEDSTPPEVDNLILNSDGRFFRVLGYDNATEKITVKLLAVSGTGGGGGSGSGSNVEPDVSITWDNDTIATGRIYIYGQDYNAVFIPTTTASGDTNCNVTFTIIDNINGTTNTIVKNNLSSGQPYNFNTSVLPESSNITLQIVVTSDNSQYNYGLGYQRNITGLRVVRMELEKPVSSSYQALVKGDDLSGTLTLKYRPIGDSSLSFNLHTYIDNEEVGTGTAIPASYLNQIVPVTIDRQEHGVHSIKFKMSTNINGSEIYSNAIEYEGAWATSGEETPIIWIGNYDKMVVNYENSYIQYMVFDPVKYASGLPAEVHLYKDGIEVSQIDGYYNDDNWLVWDISNLYTVEPNTTITPNNFAIVCGGSRVNIIVNITTEGSRDLGLVAQSNLILNMTAAGRSSNEIKRNRSNFFSTVNSENVSAVLDNFNWQNNGWKDSDGADSQGVDSGAYLSVANGSALRVTMAGNGLIMNGSKDYTFEVRFRVKNVQEYSTLVKVVPKYFYSIPDENNPGEFVPTYTIVENGDEEEISGPSLFESEIEALGYRIGLDKYGNLLMDEENSIKTTETEKGVICKWLNESGYGFCIGTQEAYFRTPSGVANVRYCEGEVINLSMVASKTDKLCYIYLNGILSGAIAMPSGTGSGFTINSPFVFNSKYCDFDLYRFRIYELGLTMPQVIHNYLSDMHSIILYDQNQITNPLDPTALSYELLVKYNQDNPGRQTMPYATWKITDGTNEILPYKKGDNRECEVDFVNPPLDEALVNGDITPWFYYTHCPSFHAEHIDINVQGTSSQKYPRRNYKLKYKGWKPKEIPPVWIYTVGPLAGQKLDKNVYYFYKNTGEVVMVENTDPDTGEVTSTPLTDKNQYDSNTMYALAKKYHMDTEDFGTNKFTWKIDYMESSETYNTGFANLMGNLVHPLYTKHPLDDLNLGIDTSDMRTTVYGFPVLTFHKYANGQYEYIGKYQMNLDKSSNEYYGFEDEHLQPYVPTRIKKVLNKTTNEYEDVEYQPTIAEIAECWELKDNQGNWCSFKYPDDASRTTGFMTLKEGTSGESAQLELLNHYEYRYSFYGDELDSAYEYDSFTDANTQVEYTNNGQINTYLYEKHKNFERLFNWLDSTNQDTATNNTLPSPVTYAVSSTSDDPTVTYTEVSSGLWNAEFTKDTKEYRRQKFKSELTSHLDKEYCLTYYVLTELLLCYDSRGKNCMMATFGPQRVGGEYIWYPIFYDIDTQLGLNNSGAYLWDYDADVTKDNLFSTPTSVLWNNLYDLFYDDIVSKYRVLRGISNPSSGDANINGSLTYENIAGAYECNSAVFNSYAMAGVRPIVAVGLDEYYKYLAPALKQTDYNAGKLYAGYYDTSGNHKYQNTPTYVYACQGDKKLTTELLLRNRLNYIDSWWMGGDYRAGVVENQIFIRANANHSSTSDLYLDSNSLTELTEKALASSQTYSLQEYPKPYFDARPGAKIKPFLHQYVSYFHDSQPSIPVKYDGGEGQEDGVWTNVDASKLQAYKTEVDLSQQIVYIPGGDYISSLGDISLMYPNSLQIFHGQRMLDFKLGSDIPGYKNPLITSSSDWELDTMPLLKSVNVSKLSRFDRELDLTGSAKLQEFRGLDSPLERVNFASGAPLRIVHLPNTMTTISLVQNQNLTKILTSRPEVVEDDDNGNYTYKDESTYEGLYLEDVTDYTAAKANTGHSIGNLEIDGGGLGYNSYTILKNLYDLKKEASAKQTLKIGLTDVQWTPYIILEKGTPYDNTETYYYLNDHSTYEPYSYVDEDTWNDDLNNSLIHIYNSEYTHNEEGTITNLDLLDDLIEQYEAAKTNGVASQFSNLVETTEATIPTITGYLYVSNTVDSKIKETDLTDIYSRYFQNLQITAKYVKESNVTKYVRIYPETGIVETIEALRSDSATPLGPTKSAPTKAGYDFIGWSTDAAGQNIFLLYRVDVNTGNGSYVNMAANLANFTFTEQNNVLTLYAQFEVHKNVVTIYSGGERIGAAIVDNGSTFTNPSYIYDYVNDQIDITTGHNYIPYKDDSQLQLTRTYKFIGYSAVSTDTTTITEAPAEIVSKDMVVYSVFDEDSVYNNVLNSEWVQCDSTGTMKFTKSGLKGKITLPKQCNGYTVTSFESVYGQPDVTHIFWEQGSSVQAYNGNAFCINSSYEGFNSLVYVEIPNDNFTVRNRAFFYCRNLFYNDMITQEIVDDFFSKITVYEGYAFGNTTIRNRVGDFLNNKTLKLSGYVTNIGYGVFNNDHIMKLQFGDQTKDFNYAYNLGAILNTDWFSNAGIKSSTSGGNNLTSLPSSIVFYYDDRYFQPWTDPDWENNFLNVLFGQISASYSYPPIEYININGG